jgi:hypothetical protein
MPTQNPVEMIDQLLAKDRRAIDLFLSENSNRDATVNDWFCATEELRENYRRVAALTPDKQRNSDD